MCCLPHQTQFKLSIPLTLYSLFNKSKQTHSSFLFNKANGAKLVEWNFFERRNGMEFSCARGPPAITNLFNKEEKENKSNSTNAATALLNGLFVFQSMKKRKEEERATSSQPTNQFSSRAAGERKFGFC